MRRIAFIALLLAAAVLVGVGLSFSTSWRGKGPLAEATSVTVPEGATLRSAARQLEESGAIGSASRFRIGARLFGDDGSIRAGTYRLPEHVSPAQILALLQSGKTSPLLVTVPEGMPSILVKERLLANKQLTGPLDEAPAEGSVLPDSYAYEPGETRAAVLARMQAAMTKLIEEKWPDRAPELGVKTPQQALTLASIVEKETALADERPIVAGVYYNRLRQGIRLGADPTIIYPITKGKALGRRILKSEIRAVNGYNTYSMAGLPVGPIANPGRAAIKAVLHPAQTKALYFVADGKGGHVFADSYAQHQANVAKWFAIRRQRGEM